MVGFFFSSIGSLSKATSLENSATTLGFGREEELSPRHWMALLDCATSSIERRVVVSVEGIEVGTIFLQYLEHLDVAAGGCSEDGRLPISLTLDLHVDTRLNQGTGHVGVFESRGDQVQGGAPALIFQIDSDLTLLHIRRTSSVSP